MQEPDSQELGFSLHHPCLVQGRDLGTKQTGQPCISAGEEAGVSKVNRAEVSKCEECLERVLTGTRWGWMSCASSHKGGTEVATPADSRTGIGPGDSCIFPPLSSCGFMLRAGERAGGGAVPVQSGKEQEGCIGSSVRDGLISPCNALLMHLSAAALSESKSSAVTQKPSSEHDGSFRGPPHLCGSRKILHF